MGGGNGIVRKPEPAWRGPQVDGVTQSMLSDYLCCQERFRIKYIEGWCPLDKFSRALEYGNLWHACAEQHAAGEPWLPALQTYTQRLMDRFPEERHESIKWSNVCAVAFPMYVRHWENHHGSSLVIPMLQEHFFQVDYPLPSGRTVKLKGVYDAVGALATSGKTVYLQDDKAKGDIDEEHLCRNLNYDLQMMTYLSALQREGGGLSPRDRERVAGIIYNVVRRPLSGGKHSITQHKGRLVNRKYPGGETVKDASGKPEKIRRGAETEADFYKRLGQLIADNSDYFFMRWKVEISQQDILRFQTQTLNPLLENLCDWYEWTSWCLRSRYDPYDYTLRAAQFRQHRPRHFRLPYGVWNAILESRGDVYQEYLETGSTVGMQRTKLFREIPEENQAE